MVIYHRAKGARRSRSCGACSGLGTTVSTPGLGVGGPPLAKVAPASHGQRLLSREDGVAASAADSLPVVSRQRRQRN